jgi:Fe2+ transport system protein FeoA
MVFKINTLPEGDPALSLATLEEGKRARLGWPERLDATTLRLMEMGLTPGTWVSVSRRAPLGDPIEVRVRQTRLCLRRVDAGVFPVVEVAILPEDVSDGGG